MSAMGPPALSSQGDERATAPDVYSDGNNDGVNVEREDDIVHGGGGRLLVGTYSDYHLDKWREAFGTAVPDIPKEGWEWEKQPVVSPGLHEVLTEAERCTTYVRSIAAARGGQPDDEGQPRGKVDWAGLRVAGLCIGVGEYTHLGAVTNAVRDAEQVHAKLNTVPSCRSDIVKDPKTKIELKRKIRKRLEEPRLQDKPPELFCLYYAGHAFEHGAKVYLVPTDARLEHVVDDCDDECLCLDSLMQLLREKLDNPTRLKIGQDRAIVFVIVLDSCRNAAAGRSIGNDQACQVPPDSAPLKYTVFFSCSRTTTASDGPSGGNSPFARALLDPEGGFFAQGVTLRDAISNVSHAVEQGTQQIPIEVRITAIPPDFCIWPKPLAQPGPGSAAGSVDVSKGAGAANMATSQYEIVAYLKKRGLRRIAERVCEELCLEEIDDLEFVKKERLDKLEWLEDVPRAKLLKLCREVTARLMSSDLSADETISQGASTPLAHSEGSNDGDGFESDGEDVFIAARNGGVCADFQEHMRCFLRDFYENLEFIPRHPQGEIFYVSLGKDSWWGDWTMCMLLWIVAQSKDATLDKSLRDKWLEVTKEPDQDIFLSTLTDCLMHPAATYPLWTLADFEACKCQKDNAAGIFFTDRVVQHALRGNEESKERWKNDVVKDWFHTAEAAPDFLIRANRFLREDLQRSIKGMSIFESVVETQSYVVFIKMSGLAAFLFFGYLEARKLDFASAAGAAGGCRTFLHGFTSFVSSEGQTFNFSKIDPPAKRALLIIVEGLLCMMYLAHPCLEVVTEVMGPVKTVKEFLERDRNVSRVMSGVGQGQVRTNHTSPNARTRMERGFQTTTAADDGGEDRNEGGFDREGNMGDRNLTLSVTTEMAHVEVASKTDDDGFKMVENTKKKKTKPTLTTERLSTLPTKASPPLDDDAMSMASTATRVPASTTVPVIKFEDIEDAKVKGTVSLAIRFEGENGRVQVMHEISRWGERIKEEPQFEGIAIGDANAKGRDGDRRMEVELQGSKERARELKTWLKSKGYFGVPRNRVIYTQEKQQQPVVVVEGQLASLNDEVGIVALFCRNEEGKEVDVEGIGLCSQCGIVIDKNSKDARCCSFEHLWWSESLEYTAGRDGKCKNCERTWENHRKNQKTRRLKGVCNLCYHPDWAKGHDGCCCKCAKDKGWSTDGYEKYGCKQCKNSYGL